MEGLKAGVYRHHSGLLVLAIGVARHSETEERLVAYIPLGVKTKPRITVRPYDMFFETVEVKGRQHPRFQYVGEEIDGASAALYDELSGYKEKDEKDVDD